MRILLIHNKYGKPSGEEMVVSSIRRLLEEHGHTVIAFTRSSAEIEPTSLGSVCAFFSGIYSRASRQAIRHLLHKQRPDLVHVHNLFPLISPSVLPECRQADFPVVMTVHNYRLVCPNGLHMTNGRICEKCCGGREYWCILRNCENNLFKSIGYALRSYIARSRNMFTDNVTMYICLSEFQRQRLIAEGFPADRIEVIPNMVEPNKVQYTPQLGQYVGYVGRISREKGIRFFLAAARQCKYISFRLAGEYNRMLQLVKSAPDNVEFLGFLDSLAIRDFYSGCHIVVLPSIWFEGFPNILIEAMLHGKPIVCSRIGALPEIVEDGKIGLLFEPGNVNDLTEKILYLFSHPDQCRQMAEAGREKALREYSPQKYYERLMAVYEKAIELGPGGTSAGS